MGSPWGRKELDTTECLPLPRRFPVHLAQLLAPGAQQAIGRARPDEDAQSGQQAKRLPQTNTRTGELSGSPAESVGAGGAVDDGAVAPQPRGQGRGTAPWPQILHPSAGDEAPRFPGGEFGIRRPVLSTESGPQ